MNLVRIIVGTPVIVGTLVAPPPAEETQDFDTPAELLVACALPEVE